MIRHFEKHSNTLRQPIFKKLPSFEQDPSFSKCVTTNSHTKPKYSHRKQTYCRVRYTERLQNTNNWGNIISLNRVCFIVPVFCIAKSIILFYFNQIATTVINTESHTDLIIKKKATHETRDIFVKWNLSQIEKKKMECIGSIRSMLIIVVKSVNIL